MDYQDVRHAHIGLAVTSIGLFAARASLALRGLDWRSRWPWLRWLPHAVDTALLVAGVTLALWSGQYPGQQAWLTAKLAALLAYIAMGRLALRPDLPVARRAGCVVAALACVGYIVMAAVTRRGWPWG